MQKSVYLLNHSYSVSLYSTIRKSRQTNDCRSRIPLVLAVTRPNSGATLRLQSLSIPDMEAQLPWLEISVFLLSSVFLFAVKVILLDDDEEKIHHFRVPVPEQCSPEWKGEVLEKPTVKVPSLFYTAVRRLTSITDFGFQCHKMLLPSQWPTTRTREPFHA